MRGFLSTLGAKLLSTSEASPGVNPIDVRKEEPVLYRAIERVSDTRLRVIVLSMCERFDKARDFASEMLLVPDLGVSEDEDEDEDDDEDEKEEEHSDKDKWNGDNEALGRNEGDKDIKGSSKPRGKKRSNDTAELDPLDDRALRPDMHINKKPRVRLRYETCENCKKEYDFTTNAQGDCVYHDGELEETDDDDFWADTDHVSIDMADEYPEGFIWTCCDRITNEAGCIVTRHSRQKN
ncbi:MAG: hypothetical protein M1825_003528 [Sarcosagium campestre]|nr:MAG: hypothetical protein M1825_003528 [Sarcosagium campestre]